MTLHAESAERELRKLVEKRARFFETEEANGEDAAWRESERRYSRARAGEIRALWASYFRHRIALHEDMAEANRRKLNTLVDGEARGRAIADASLRRF